MDSLRWQIYIITTADKTKLLCNAPHRCSTTDFRDFTASFVSHLFQRTKNTAAATPTANKQNPNERDTANIVLDELSCALFACAFASTILVVVLLLVPSVVSVAWRSSPVVVAVVVGKIFVVLTVVRSNSSVGAELGEIVLSVVVALDCGRCTGVVLLVNDSLSKKEK